MTTGVWPCKINGCNKQFAREADLKRHQRTTKLHSMPSFLCPMCDATFTRLDALRRHQKSRHNGVLIDPPGQDLKDDAEDDGSSGSQSKSRSTTPSSKGKEKSSVPPVTQEHGQNAASGPSKYYRQHTSTISPAYPARPPIMDPQYAQIALPTSATRLNLATHWGYPHPWPDGPPQQMGYQQLYFNPHYRPNGPPGQPPPPTNTIPSQTLNGPVVTQTISPTTRSAPQNPATDVKSTNDGCSPANSSLPIINPVLNPSDSTTLTEEQVLQITQAAMNAMLEAEAERAKAEHERSTPSGSETEEPTEDSPREDNGTPSNDLVHEGPHTIPGYSLALARPEPMEHMLTEDGEPMLNPAELLTQESLASPPPS